VMWDEFDAYLIDLQSKRNQRVSSREVSERAVIRCGPSEPILLFSDLDRGNGKNPACAVTMETTQCYAKWISEQTGGKFRIPTEAEWEFAARAGGGGEPIVSKEQLNKIAWFKDNSGDEYHPVGRKEPNAWGLHDTLGNVWEWTVNPDGKAVARGGGFTDPIKKVFIGSRQTDFKQWRVTDLEYPQNRWRLSDGQMVGMRLVMDE
jgi:formylglycine-generating enzyme